MAGEWRDVPLGELSPTLETAIASSEPRTIGPFAVSHEADIYVTDGVPSMRWHQRIGRRRSDWRHRTRLRGRRRYSCDAS